MNDKNYQEYYYLIMSQTDFIQNQVLEEVLRERATYYNEKKKSLDFWVLVSPSFIKKLDLERKIINTNFYKQQEDKNCIYYCSLISLDKEFINWIQLRLGYFENINIFSSSEINPRYVSDGLYGSFLDKESDKLSVLESNSSIVDPKIILNLYKKIVSYS